MAKREAVMGAKVALIGITTPTVTYATKEEGV